MSNKFIFKFKYREMLYLSTLEKIIVTIGPSNSETWSLSRKRKQEELRWTQERGVIELSDGWHHLEVLGGKSWLALGHKQYLDCIITLKF